MIGDSLCLQWVKQSEREVFIQDGGGGRVWHTRKRTSERGEGRSVAD